MGQSGNPAKKAAAKKTAAKKTTAKKSAAKKSTKMPDGPLSSSVSDIAAFKARKMGQPLLLPSGLVVRARRVEVQAFLMRGDVPNPLMVLVSEALEKGQETNVEEMLGLEDGQVDIDKVRDMYELVNALTCEIVVEPKVHPLPDDEEDRDDELLYVDEVDDEDKMFLFQWVQGGTDDVATFREEARTTLDALGKG